MEPPSPVSALVYDFRQRLFFFGLGLGLALHVIIHLLPAASSSLVALHYRSLCQ